MEKSQKESLTNIEWNQYVADMIGHRYRMYKKRIDRGEIKMTLTEIYSNMMTDIDDRFNDGTYDIIHHIGNQNAKDLDEAIYERIKF